MNDLVVSANKEMNIKTAGEVERLLRSLGASGRLTGFTYLVYIVTHELEQPYSHRFVTKCIYPETGAYFGVKPGSVERGVRTVVKNSWKRSDHSVLDNIAGVHLETIPTNSEFIDMLVAYVRFGKLE